LFRRIQEEKRKEGNFVFDEVTNPRVPESLDFA
jgi:hypothetical protein